MSHLPPSHKAGLTSDPIPTEQPETSTAGETLRQHAQHSARTVGSNPVDAAQLLGPAGEVKLAHNGEIYSLRRTRNGRLILTK